ncbi:MAG TPA: hypothetical protein VK421_18055 [Pyrinomonadaceae bacterium]|nr:hypothetical protein [Pyrinomonadaceae bacterium]
MTKDTLSAIGSAMRGTLRDWPALLALAVLFAALAASAGLFITTREATAWQVFLTFALALIVPLLLSVVLAGCAYYAVGHRRAIPLVVRSLKGFWKVLLLGLPVLALTVLTVWGMDKLEARVRHDPQAEASETFSQPDGMNVPDNSAEADRPAERRKPEVRWAYVFYWSLRLLLLGVVLPLLAAHLWLAAARDGLGAALRGIHRLVARAFSPRSVFIYAVGMLLFALVPYFLLTRGAALGTGWLAVALFSARVGLALLLMLFGWLTTMTALARTFYDGGPAVVAVSTPAPATQDAPRADAPVGAAG